MIEGLPPRCRGRELGTTRLVESRKPRKGRRAVGLLAVREQETCSASVRRVQDAVKRGLEGSSEQGPGVQE